MDEGSFFYSFVPRRKGNGMTMNQVPVPILLQFWRSFLFLTCVNESIETQRNCQNFERHEKSDRMKKQKITTRTLFHSFLPGRWLTRKCLLCKNKWGDLCFVPVAVVLIDALLFVFVVRVIEEKIFSPNLFVYFSQPPFLHVLVL